MRHPSLRPSSYLTIEITKGEGHEETLESIHARVEVMIELGGMAGDAGGAVQCDQEVYAEQGDEDEGGAHGLPGSICDQTLYYVSEREIVVLKTGKLSKTIIEMSDGSEVYEKY